MDPFVILVQMNRQKPSQQPSRKKSNTLPSTGSHRHLHRAVSHRWMFCLGQVPTQASQAVSYTHLCDDVCSGTSPRQRHLPVFSQSVCREFVWEQRIRPGSLCRASAVCFICLCSLPCVGDSINLFSHHVNRFILSKTNPPFHLLIARCFTLSSAAFYSSDPWQRHQGEPSARWPAPPR